MSEPALTSFRSPPPPIGSLIHRSDFVEAIAPLFGTRATKVLRAVDAFIRRRPGSLDHHCLEMIAAAGRHFEDKNHVAYMIDALEVSGMNVALEELDTAAIAHDLDSVLGHFRTETARKLTLDLARSTALQILKDSPPERVPEAGSEIVRADLRRMLKGSTEDRNLALQSPFMTAELVTFALDKIGRRTLDALVADEGNVGINAWQLVDSFFSPTSHPTVASVISANDLRRAWQLFGRHMSLTETAETALIGAASNARLLAIEGEAVLEVLDAYFRERPDTGIQTELRGKMLGARGLAEGVARQMVRIEPRAHVVDMGDVQPFDIRLATVRLEHYESSVELLPPLTSDEIDLRYSSLPGSYLCFSGLASVTNVQALATLVDRAEELSPDAFSGLAANPLLEPGHISQIIDSLDSERYRWAGSTMPERVTSLLVSPKIDDSQIARLVRQVTERGLPRVEVDLFLEIAASNPSAGPITYQEVVAHSMQSDIDRQNALMSRIAQQTKSHWVQSMLADEAISGSMTSQHVIHLARSAMLFGDIWQRLVDAEPEWRSMAPLTRPETFTADQASLPFAAPTHDHVIELVVSGEASPGRADNVARDLCERGIPERTVRRNVSRLLDAGVVSRQFSVEATGDKDPHIALLFATHPSFQGLPSRLESRGAAMVRATVHAIDNGALIPPDRRLVSWSQLPNRDDEPFAVTAFHELVDGQQVGGLRLVVPATRRELEHLSKIMGNCLDSHGARIAADVIKVAYLHDGSEVYAAMWEAAEPGSTLSSQLDAKGPATGDRSRQTSRIVLTDVNSKYNRAQVPPEIVDALETMTNAINDGTLSPVDHVSSTEAQALSDRSTRDLSSQQARRPPARRTAVPRLPPLEERERRPHRSDDRETGEPFVLASRQVAGDDELHEVARRSTQDVPGNDLDLGGITL